MTLIEIVSEPDMRSPKEARRYLDKLRSILDYLDVFNGDLEGAMRVDANVSVFNGERVEVKNISSFKGAERALLYEIMRQKNHVRRGGKIVLETRHFDEARGVTISMRTKEEEHDYRYFPEPDLVPMRVADRVPGILRALPELPDAKRERFISQYGIADMHARALTTEIKVANFYEEVASQVDAKAAAVWVADILKGELNYRDIGIDAFTVEDIVAVIGLVKDDKITEQSGVQIIRTVLDEGGRPQDIVVSRGLLKVEDDIVAKAVEEAVAESPEAVADYLAGKEKSLNFIVGKVMQKTKGRADARETRERVLARINK
jgi:aspartyl-tRNA(Asn)/glutamyl-tRNA(Gln) amidotransferase subunit B